MDNSHDPTKDPGEKPGSFVEQAGSDKGKGNYNGMSVEVVLSFGSKKKKQNTKDANAGADPRAAQAGADWGFLNESWEALAGIDRRAAREQLIRGWDRDVIHELRRDRGILEMGVAFLDFMERGAPGAETAEELLRGADATLGYMVYDVGKLVKKREKLTEALDELDAKAASEDAQTVLRRLGAADPSEALREAKTARKKRDAARLQRADAALTSVLDANRKAARYVSGALENEKNHKALTLEDTEAERIFPALRALLEEERFAALKEGGLPELRDSLAAWAGEIEEKLIKIYYNNQGTEG